MQLSGKITYNGERFDQFYPQRTAVYVNQVRCPHTVNLYVMGVVEAVTVVRSLQLACTRAGIEGLVCIHPVLPIMRPE